MRTMSRKDLDEKWGIADSLCELLDAALGPVREEGEYYRICCPFCGDTRYRLYIGKEWLSRDPDAGEVNEHEACCFNEDCLRKNYGKLKQMLFSDQPAMPFRRPKVVRRPPVIALLPPNTAALTDLEWNHPALMYLRKRGIYEAAIDAWAAYNPELGGIEGNRGGPRIVIPFYLRGGLLGWQARTIEADVVPKYFTMPGMKKSHTLYNFDAAARWPAIMLFIFAVKVPNRWPPAFDNGWLSTQPGKPPNPVACNILHGQKAHESCSTCF